MEKHEWEIAWSERLSVGNTQMDEEHRQFVARVNDLNRAITLAEDKATVERLMDLMLMEATQHFRHEQELLARCNYPETAAHTAAHAELTAQFARVMTEIAASELSYVWALKGLRFKQLLVEHLLHADMKYRDFLRARETLPSGN